MECPGALLGPEEQRVRGGIDGVSAVGAGGFGT